MDHAVRSLRDVDVRTSVGLPSRTITRLRLMCACTLDCYRVLRSYDRVYNPDVVNLPIVNLQTHPGFNRQTRNSHDKQNSFTRYKNWNVSSLPQANHSQRKHQWHWVAYISLHAMLGSPRPDSNRHLLLTVRICCTGGLVHALLNWSDLRTRIPRTRGTERVWLVQRALSPLHNH